MSAPRFTAHKTLTAAQLNGLSDYLDTVEGKADTAGTAAAAAKTTADTATTSIAALTARTTALEGQSGNLRAVELAASGAVSLDATHLGKLVTLLPGATLAVDWAKAGAGFHCVVANATGATVTPALIGFSDSKVSNALGLTGFMAGGVVLLVASSPDGVSRLLRAGGDLT